MKKLIAMLLVLTMVLAFAGCAKTEAPAETTESGELAAPEAGPGNAPADLSPGEGPSDGGDIITAAPIEAAADVLSHQDYMGAPLDAPVTVETYVQAHQSWWDNKVTVYCQSPDGAYFLYELACSEEDAAKLVPGTKIQVSGTKGEWEGEVEIMSGTFKFVEGGDTFIAEAADVTALLGTDELIDHQNEFVSFKGLTIEAIEYKNGEPGDDIYVTVSLNGANYDFCVERYLTDPDTDVYKAFADLKAGDVVDMEGFLYWYQGPNPHITSVALAQ